MSIVYFFTVIGFIATIIVANITVKNAWNNIKEANRQEQIDVNDIPDWQPLNPAGKMANKELKKMYRGNLSNQLTYGGNK